jgi:hypothetical protein
MIMKVIAPPRAAATSAERAAARHTHRRDDSRRQPFALLIAYGLGLVGMIAGEALPPPWPLAVVASLLTVMLGGWLLWHRADERRARGLCVQCGYDLRATPVRCPECGSRP